MKQIRPYVIAVVAVVLVNILAQVWVCRYDMTDDRRYSLSEATKQMLRETDEEIEIVRYLAGDLNSGFRRLSTSTRETIEEMGVYADIRQRQGEAEEAEQMGLSPIVIHEREQNGKTAQTMVYPYAAVRYKGRQTVVTLLQNQRGLSGEENLNHSIENLEFALAEAIHRLQQTEKQRIVFLEGHGELPEQNVWDAEQALGRYYEVDRGVPGYDTTCLKAYRCVIVADPQIEFEDSARWVLDQYLMQGGRILWLLNGVRFSNEYLAQEGFTPMIAHDLHLGDMLFRYGVRIRPVVVQDVQCLPVPVNVSTDGQQPNYQPMPWYYAPILLTNQHTPITRNLGGISTTFASVVEAVGEDDGIRKEVLLATSDASRLIGAPTKVDLGDLNPDMAEFRYQYVPVAMSLEGRFPSAYRHLGSKRDSSVPTRQVVAASGSIIRNEMQDGQPLPMGMDRYSGMQFANRDFIVHSVLWLCDEDGLIALREKQVSMRLINDKRSHQYRRQIQATAVGVPLILLVLTGVLYPYIRRKRFTK